MPVEAPWPTLALPAESFEWNSPFPASQGHQLMLHRLFPKEFWKNLTIFSGHAGMTLEQDQHLYLLLSKLPCTVSAAAETNYFQATNDILMRPAMTETITVLQAGVLLCRQVVLDLEIRASCTTGTKEMLSGYRLPTPKPIYSSSPFPEHFSGMLVLL